MGQDLEGTMVSLKVLAYSIETIQDQAKARSQIRMTGAH